MKDYFDSVETIDEDEFVSPQHELCGDSNDDSPSSSSSPRKRLEMLMEERRLQRELDDFLD